LLKALELISWRQGGGSTYEKEKIFASLTVREEPKVIPVLELLSGIVGEKLSLFPSEPGDGRC